MTKKSPPGHNISYESEIMICSENYFFKGDFLKMEFNKLLEICISNPAVTLLQQELKTMEEKNWITTITYDCLGFCETCSECSYVLLEGDIMSASSNQELLKKIIEELKLI